ncbi:MAG TPA: hypothetical protein VFV50_02615 [Bdellovibrionales bacterium]|nr:hypothetical protein [Bdellovibrionales bacterium]
MTKLITALVLFAVPAFAHISPGVHKGLTADNKECAMTVGETYFENNVKHPLNERIKIQVDGNAFLVGHPPVVDMAQTLAFFNHDLFQGVLPTATGAKALVIEMSHEEGREGSKAFMLIENKWKTGEKAAIRCTLKK